MPEMSFGADKPVNEKVIRLPPAIEVKENVGNDYRYNVYTEQTVDGEAVILTPDLFANASSSLSRADVPKFITHGTPVLDDRLDSGTALHFEPFPSSAYSLSVVNETSQTFSLHAHLEQMRNYEVLVLAVAPVNAGHESTAGMSAFKSLQEGSFPVGGHSILQTDNQSHGLEGVMHPG